MSAPEDLFALHVRAEKLPMPIREYKAIPDRKFRFDFAWPDHKLLVEIHGGVYSQGRHTRGVGFTKDREKMRTAQKLGYTVYEYTTSDVTKGIAIDDIKEFFDKRGEDKK